VCCALFAVLQVVPVQGQEATPELYPELLRIDVRASRVDILSEELPGASSRRGQGKERSNS